MKLSKPIYILQFFATLFIVGMMFYSMITRRELYPFAPYTMYSRGIPLEKLLFYKFVCKVGDSEIPLKNEMMVPMDEARLEQSINTEYVFNRNVEAIKRKLTDLKKHINSNSFECERVILRVKFYYNAKEYIRDEGITHEIIMGDS